MNRPTVVERYADNGEHSHWDLIDTDTGETLWTGDTEQLHKPDVGRSLPTDDEIRDLLTKQGIPNIYTDGKIQGAIWLRDKYLKGQ
ncbi:MAG: hypothetical protein VKL60_16260 [Sphaerospermopsis sp.]|nr:hypothetical protein [Sphaerospermopsis sp.]